MAEPSDPTPNEPASHPIILLDNNVLQHFLNKNTGPLLQGILEEVKKSNVTLGTSDIIVYEALKAIIFNSKKSEAVSQFIDDYLTRYPVDLGVLAQAARVHEIYGCDPDTRQRRSGISTEDIVIGTTAMMLGAYILTSDCNDFPMPFFKENNRQIVYYNEGNKRKHIVIYLLEPDNEVITAALASLMPTQSKNEKS